MAPNGTYYGALKMGEFEDEPKRSGASKLVVAAGVVFLCTVGVFAMTMGRNTAINGANMVVNEQEEAIPGDGDTIAKDCRCANPCDTSLRLQDPENPDHTLSLHYCDVRPSDVCEEGEVPCQCIGIDDNLYTHYEPDQPCEDEDGNLVMVDDIQNPGQQLANCQAVCEYVYGRYDCWSYPCFNDGFCIDGIDGYTCECEFGYAGEACELNIDECVLEDPVDMKPYGQGTLEQEPLKVCDPKPYIRIIKDIN
jgi:hypothetical protein